MVKAVKRVGICLLVVILFWCGTFISDRQRLNRELIRFHVIANSDGVADQNLKLRVRDAVLAGLQADLHRIGDVNAAKSYLQEKLPYIQTVAEETLRSLGCTDSVTVDLCQSFFDTRIYDTFTLPAGVYNALRIVIGDGEGKNWWCVAFPTLCVPVSADGFEDTASTAGFPEALTCSLTGETGYELRFGFLDLLGRLENKLFHG